MGRGGVTAIQEVGETVLSIFSTYTHPSSLQRFLLMGNGGLAYSLAVSILLYTLLLVLTRRQGIYETKRRYFLIMGNILNYLIEIALGDFSYA